MYGQYLNLDKDHNGMLSKSELLAYGTATLTPTFIDRVFEECLTYGGEMDYKTYLDFVLALENRKEPQSLTYFFRILDVKHQGFINTFCLNYFFRDILKQMEKLNQDPVKFEDVKDEIFDMKVAEKLREKEVSNQESRVKESSETKQPLSVLVDKHSSPKSDLTEKSSYENLKV